MSNAWMIMSFVGGVSVYWLFGVGTNYKQKFNFHVKEEKIKANWLEIPIR